MNAKGNARAENFKNTSTFFFREKRKQKIQKDLKRLKIEYVNHSVSSTYINKINTLNNQIFSFFPSTLKIIFCIYQKVYKSKSIYKHQQVLTDLTNRVQTNITSHLIKNMQIFIYFIY